MQFLLNPNPLPLSPIRGSKKVDGIQYYEWLYKQRTLKEEHERNTLMNYLANLEKQEENQQRNNINQRRKTRESGTFYDYNLKWKKKIQCKIEQEKAIKNEQMAKLEEGSMHHEIRQDRRQILKEYKGPVEGWQEHFQSYIRSRSLGLSGSNEEATFQPKINPKSKKIAEGMSGRVEDRLILFGQFLKLKLKEEEINKNNEEMGTANRPGRYSSCLGTQEELFSRLFKEGEESIKRRKELPLDENHTFRPKLNKLPEEIEDKIMRKRKPLYHLRQQPKTDNTNTEQPKREQRGNFQSFLRRNDALINMKKKLLQTMRQKMYEKENLERSKCTFAPALNSTSIKINKQARDTQHDFDCRNNMENKQQMNYGSSIHEPHMENIDISKLTVVEPKETSRFEDLDSLSVVLKIESTQTKVANYKDRTIKKQGTFQTSKSQQYDKHSSTEKAKQSTPGASPSPEKIGEEEDSIENMKNYEWETQLEEIENHLQKMMARVTR